MSDATSINATRPDTNGPDTNGPQPPPPPIRFGIPSLDVLLGRLNPQVYGVDSTQENQSARKFGIYENPASSRGDESLCLCIIGTDGTGKSVLAMHLAAYYLADRPKSNCRVIYASTDLSLDRARTTWENFALGFPSTRITDPFDFNEVRRREGLQKQARARRSTGTPPAPELSIAPMPPSGPRPRSSRSSPAASRLGKCSFSTSPAGPAATTGPTSTGSSRASSRRRAGTY